MALQKAQIRVAELEAQLFEAQSNPLDLKISENTYYHPLDTLLVGCQLIGFDWRYRYSNEAALRYEQGTKAEFLGHTLMERHPGIEKTAMFAVLQRCMRERSVARIEREIVDAEGGAVWVDLLVQPVPEGLLIFSHDITERKQVELALLEREQQFRLLMEHAPAALAMLDNNMRYLLVSRRWLTDYRLSAANVIGRSHYDLFPDLPEEWKEVHQRGLAGAVEYSDADPFPRADGSLDRVRWEIQPWRKLDGKIGGILILSEVITERKRAEENIRKLHRTLGVLSDINQTIVRIRHLPSLFEKACTIAVEKGAFRAAWLGLVNPKTACIDPVAHAGIAGSALEKPITLLNTPPVLSALRTGAPLICNNLQTDPLWLAWREEAWRLGYNATVVLPLLVAGELRGIFTLYASETAFFDEQEMRLMDEMAGDIAFAMEVAEQEEQRRKAEADLRTNEEKYRSLIESAESSIAMFDERGVLLYANQIAETALALTQEEAVGRQMHELFPAPVAQYQINSIQQVIRTGQGTVRETPNFLGGEERWYRTSVQPIRDAAGKISSAFINAVDITRLKRAEADLRNERDSLEQKVAERTADLQTALEQVKAILNNSPDAILLVDTDLTIQQTNSSFHSLFGAEADADLGQSLLTLFHPDDAGRLADFAQRATIQQNSSHVEVRAICKDGATFDAEINTGRIQGDGLVYNIRDITERKTQERQLRYHAAMQENVSDAVIVTDMQFRIQSWNQAAVRMYGWTAEEAIGKVAPDFLQIRFSPAMNRESGLKQFNAEGALQQETIQRRKDGTDIFILGSATRLNDEKGVPVGVIAINRNITERKAQERQLRYHASIQESVSDAVIATDMAFRIQSWNRAAEHIYGWSAAEAIGQSVEEILQTAYASAADHQRILHDFLDHGAWQGEVIQRHRDGSILYVHAAVNLFKDETGQPFGVVSVNRDITARKYAEETLQIKMAEEHQFQVYLKALHEIIIELTGIDHLDTFYKRAVELGRERLGFERLAMFLYNDQDDSAVGTYGTDIQGKLIDERGVRFKPDPHGIMQRSFERIERFYIKEGTTLYNDTVPVGYGWNAAAALWNGTRNLGWFVTDNLLSHAPAAKPQLDIIGLYALSVGTLLAQKQTQVALKESEALYRLLAENISDLIMRSTLTGECLYVSPSVQTLLGYTPEELSGQQTFSQVHPDDQAIIGVAYAAALERHDLILPHQYRARHKAGHYIWLETVGKPLFRDGSNELLEIITSSRDITARKQAEEAVRESEARYRLLAENLADVIMTFALDRQITYMSPSCKKLLGYLPAEVEGKSHSEFIHPADYPQVLERTRQAVVAKEDSYTNQFRLRHKAGHYIWHEVRTRLVWEGPTGNIVQFISVLRDITERKQAEDARRESEEKYRALVETMRGGLAVFDTELRVTFVNDRFCELLGYTREEIIGKQPTSFVDSVAIPLIQAQIARRQRAESAAYELPLRHKDGHQIPVLLSGSPLLDKQGNYNGSFVVATDISTQKQAEQTLRQALAKEKELGELKTRFVSMASHEFRTPLATILALVETLSAYRTKLSEEQIEQRLTKIKTQIGHLKTIMEDVLMLARMQARRVEFNPVTLDLDALFRSVLDEFQSQAEIKHRLVYTVSEGMQEVFLDRKLMRQIFSNLLSNAIKYSPEGKVVYIHLAYTAAAVSLKISDEGIGIPQADLPHLFEPFHRATNVGTISGTGLGLVITREAVELHGGTITVESQQGIGTTFLIRIPLATAAA